MFSLNKLSKNQKDIRRKILEISYKMNYSHLGSCLSAVDLIDAVYTIKKKNEHFILSNGHAGVALYIILEKKGLVSREAIEKLFIHPDRNPTIDIHVSTGSLGQGLPIAVGMAIANRKRDIYCMISDGECAEGSIWEALRVASEQKLHNLKIILNANGWGAYDAINLRILEQRLMAFGCHVIKVDGHNSAALIVALRRKMKNKPILFFAKTIVAQLPFLKGQDAHYHLMNDQEHSLAIKLLQ